MTEIQEVDPGRSTGVEGAQSIPDSDRAAADTYGVVVPIYDEPVDAWLGLLFALLDAGWDEVALCADAPDDETREALERVGRWSTVHVSVSEDRRGKGGALQAGLHAVDGDVIGYVDADGAVTVEDLERLYEVVERGDADVAIGSRDVADACRSGQSLPRRVLAAGYRWLARRITGAPVTDFQCGAKAFRRDAWEAVAPEIRESGFVFDTELVGRTHRSGFTIEEVSIDWRDPGDSDVEPTRDAPRMLSALLRMRREWG